MIFTNPNDGVLKSADIIALFDKAVPDWHEIVVSVPESREPSTTYLVVDIPVDSTDAVAVQAWRDRIVAARR
jgi:hypothetical protein